MASAKNNHTQPVDLSSSRGPPPSYPSPSMAYAYPQPPSGQAGEAEGPYRAQAAATSLPPFREIDPRTQHPPAPSTLPPAMAQYYPGPAQSMPPPLAHANAAADASQPARYPLPAADGRIMSGGRHKKEIKRRTKTGCLTCRRRRIKCDEGHPTCRNCVKSKRECLGYDPVYKPQPGPAAIQPAPSASPSLQPAAASASPYLQASQGYMAASAQPFAQGLAAGAGSPGSSNEYDYSGAIDPQLQGEGVAPLQPPGALYDGLHDERMEARPIRIQDNLDVPGFPCPSQLPSGPFTKEEEKAMADVFTTLYAPAVDKFLETRWYTACGLPHMLANSRLSEQFAGLIARFGITAQSNWPQYQITQSLETHVVWGMLQLAHPAAAAAAANPTDTRSVLEISEGIHETAKRIEVFLALISNRYLDSNPLLHAPTPTSGPRNVTKIDEQIKSHGRDFWYQLALFLTLRDDGASVAGEIDGCITELRRLLDSMENRDVLYSFAVARHLGQRITDDESQLTAAAAETDADAGAGLTPEQNPRVMLRVARNHIRAEARGEGTTQVVVRLCAIVQRCWVGLR